MRDLYNDPTMGEFDLSLDNEQEFDLDLPAEQVKTEALRKEEAALLTAAQGQLVDEEENSGPAMMSRYRFNFDALGAIDVNELVGGTTASIYQQDYEAASEVGVEYPDALAQFATDREYELTAPDSLQRSAVEALSTTDSLVEQAAIANSYIGYKAFQLVEDTSAIGSVINSLDTFFLPTAYKDWTDLPGVDAFSAAEDLDQMAVKIASMSPEERIRIYPLIQEMSLEAADGNEDRAQQFIRSIYALDEASIGTDAFFDTLAVLGLGGPTAIRGAIKGGKFLSTVRNVNPPQAGALVAGAAQSDDVADALNMTRANAAESLSPFKYEPHSTGAIDGVEQEAVKALDDVRVSVNDSFDDMLDNQVVRSPLTMDEQKAAQAKALSKFNDVAADWHRSHGWAASNAAITKSDEFGFTVDFDMVDASGAPMRTKPQRMTYTKNDVGEYEAATSGGFETSLTSPSVYVNKRQADLVELASAIGFNSEAMLNRLMTTANDVLKPLSRASTKKVDDLLLMGDAYKDAAGVTVGKVYTPKELMLDGVPGMGVLSREEARAYYGMRQMWDNVHTMQDMARGKQLAFDGFRSVGKFDGENIVGKAIKLGELPSSTKRVMNLETNVAVTLTDDIAQAVKRGEMEYVSLNGTIDLGDEVFEYALIRKGASKNIPLTGNIPYKVGYVPLIRPNAYYVVESQATKIINGTEGKVPQVVRTFDNKTDADNWAALQKQETGIDHIARADREIDPRTKSDLQDAQFGRPFTGKRVRDREIVHGFNGEQGMRMSAWEAMERNFTSMATAIPMNEFRMGQTERWLRTARPYLSDPSNPNSGFKVGIANQTVENLEAVRKWLDDQFKMPTLGEQKWAGTMRGMAEWMEGSQFFLNGKGKRARIAMQDLANVDPSAALRGATFHALLGWFNPAQLLVQAAGASMAISLAPHRFPALAARYQGLRASLYTTDAAAKKVGERMIKGGLYNGTADEWVELVRAYKRTGVSESLRTTADYNAARAGYGIDAGGLARAYGNVKDKSLIFYREGELFTRSYGWLMAADDLMQAKKITNASKLTDVDIDAITSQGLKYTMNMNRANRASWQKGIMSIPTQFWQVNAKFIETMLPAVVPGANKALTGSQKARVALGQFGLFGAAGIPMGTVMFQGLADWTGQDLGDLDDAEIAAARQGAVGWAVQAMMGEEVEVSERFAFAGGLNMLAEIIGGDKQFTEVMLGAMGSLPNRGIEALSALAPRFTTAPLTQADAYAVGTELAGIISTFRNGHKAYVYAKLGELRTADGTTIDYVDWGEDWRMVIAQGLGFPPSKISEYYDIKKSDRQRGEDRRNAIRALEKSYRQMVTAGISDPSNTEKWHILSSMIIESVGSPTEQEAVQQAWSKKMLQTPDLWDITQKAVENYTADGNLSDKNLPLGVLRSRTPENQ